MDKQDREQLRQIVSDLEGWRHRAEQLGRRAAAVATAAGSAREQILAGVVPVGTNPAYWSLFTLTEKDRDRLAALAVEAALPAAPPLLVQGSTQLLETAAPAFSDVKAILGARRMFTGRAKKDTGAQAGSYLASLHQWVQQVELPALLQQAENWNPEAVPRPALEDVLRPDLGLTDRLTPGATLLPRSLINSAVDDVAVVERALHQESDFRKKVMAAGTVVRQAEARKLVSEMPIERLKDATNGQVRIAALTSAGIHTVQQVLDRGTSILTLPGVGETTGNRMVGAARTIWQTTLDEMPVRIDIAKRSKETTSLLAALGAWDAARTLRLTEDDIEATKALRLLSRRLERAATHTVVMPGARTVDQLHAWVKAIAARAGGLRTAGGSASRDPWDDFLARPADYFAMLSELGFITEDEEKSQGDLPAEIVEAIRETKLDTTHLKASLRGYQSFGARFALVQRKVIIGDEMGLGKTVESLAVLTHLRAKGSHHFLVVCPAAVVTNWTREVASKSELRAHRVHGPGRDYALTSWIRNGGVAVTTYDSLGWLEGQIPDRAQPACLVFDEAHYIKNPDAQRTRRSLALIRRCERTILLTGTPLENRIEEFRNLVGYLRPDLSVSATEFAPRQFRKQVAPAYLRRNQEDVLTELPELVEVEEWMPLSPADQTHYRGAVMAGNFMAMRQAAMRAGQHSEKMQRLFDIVEEAEANERKVLVFSHFRDTLDAVTASLPGKVFGPLTGSVPAAKRQQMVDEFSNASHGAVLVAQIVAGGVGLNIQSASVVVICEPQLKPTTEWQAIARSRRMGQVQSVQVHRLLSEEGVDVRVTEILAQKSELFAEFARVSETAGSAPEAFDVTDAEIAKEIVAAERERLLSAP